jgi:hypothetical protein
LPKLDLAELDAGNVFGRALGSSVSATDPG